MAVAISIVNWHVGLRSVSLHWDWLCAVCLYLGRRQTKRDELPMVSNFPNLFTVAEVLIIENCKDRISFQI